jgi:DNA-directed RNA polymerase specialized sigma24 family protein
MALIQGAARGYELMTPADFLRLFHVIIRKRVIDHVRKEYAEKRGGGRQRVDIDRVEPCAPGPSPSSELNHVERRSFVEEKILGRLSPDERQLVFCIFTMASHGRRLLLFAMKVRTPCG